MFSGHSIVTINNYDLIQVSDIKNYSANFNPHLYFILGVPRWYFKKVRSYFFDRTKVKYTVILAIIYDIIPCPVTAKLLLKEVTDDNPCDPLCSISSKSTLNITLIVLSHSFNSFI